MSQTLWMQWFEKVKKNAISPAEITARVDENCQCSQVTGITCDCTLLFSFDEILNTCIPSSDSQKYVFVSISNAFWIYFWVHSRMIYWNVQPMMSVTKMLRVSETIIPRLVFKLIETWVRHRTVGTVVDCGWSISWKLSLDKLL